MGTGRNYPSICFASSELAVGFDGDSKLLFFNTGKRNISKDSSAIKQWTAVGTYEFEESFSSLLYAVGTKDNSGPNALVFHVVTAKTVPEADDLNENTRIAERVCQINFEGSEFPETAFLSNDASLFQIAGFKDFNLPRTQTTNKSQLSIKCSQNEKFLKVEIGEITTCETDLQVQIMSNTLRCFDKQQQRVLIEAEFYSEVIADRCNWSLETESRNLVLMLEKKEIDSVWHRLFEKNEWQSCVIMATVENEPSAAGGDKEVDNRPYNIEELEGCDDFSATEKSKWQLFELKWNQNHTKTCNESDLKASTI